MHLLIFYLICVFTTPSVDLFYPEFFPSKRGRIVHKQLSGISVRQVFGFLRMASSKVEAHLYTRLATPLEHIELLPRQEFALVCPFQAPNMLESAVSHLGQFRRQKYFSAKTSRGMESFVWFHNFTLIDRKVTQRTEGRVRIVNQKVVVQAYHLREMGHFSCVLINASGTFAHHFNVTIQVLNSFWFNTDNPGSVVKLAFVTVAILFWTVITIRFLSLTHTFEPEQSAQLEVEDFFGDLNYDN